MQAGIGSLNPAKVSAQATSPVLPLRHPPTAKEASENAEPPKAEPPKDEHFWHELRTDLRDYILHFDHERIDDFSRFFKDFGGVLKDGWKVVRDLPDKILNHPIIADKVDKDDRDFWSDLGGQVGMIAGFTAAGGHALAGTLKLGSAIRHGHVGRGLDGLVDIASGTSLALAVAGLAGARAIVAPIAATINLVRGGYNTAVGFKRGDDRKQLQGTMDIARSVSTLGRLLRHDSAILGAVGIAFAPIAGALQAGRGMNDLATGLRNNDNKKELKGLVDIATAVGTAMAFASGVAVIPGIALAVAANVLKFGYQISPRVRKRVDKVLDKHEPKLEKMVQKTERATAPVVNLYKKIMGRFIKNVDPVGPAYFSRSELAEITNLLHIDGRYSREEESRLRIDLEEVGQKRDLPKRKSAPPPLLRAELVRELETPESRSEFVRFLLVVADYNYESVPAEIDFVKELATDTLGLTPEEFQKLVDERVQERLKLVVKAGLTLPLDLTVAGLNSGVRLARKVGGISEPEPAGNVPEGVPLVA